jgi:hypothetical protein
MSRAMSGAWAAMQLLELSSVPSAHGNWLVVLDHLHR